MPSVAVVAKAKSPLLARTLAEAIPPFLDRIYYRGPASDHYDGKHFFNPEDRGREPLRLGSGAAARHDQ